MFEEATAATVMLVWNPASETVGTGETAMLLILAWEATMISSGSELSGDPENQVGTYSDSNLNSAFQKVEF